jgi:hypothetical protein
MKKLLLIPLILLLSATLYTDQEKEVYNLSVDISNRIVKHQHSLKKQGYKIEDLWWSSYNYAMPGSKTTYPMVMKAGKNYIFYTKVSKKAKVRVCVVCYEDKNLTEYTNYCKNYIIFKYHANRTGNYHYIVKGCGGSGIHVSYATEIKGGSL